MVSFTISISSEGVAASYHTASLYSTRFSPSTPTLPPPYHHPAKAKPQPQARAQATAYPHHHSGSRTRTSISTQQSGLENLLPKRWFPYKVHTNQIPLRSIPRKCPRMTGNNDMGGGGQGTKPVQIETKKSFGIGGAGNIRRPSDVPFPIRLNSDGTRRRSSVWSSMTVSPGSSPEGRRASLMNLFGGRKGSVDEVKLKDVDLTGKGGREGREE